MASPNRATLITTTLKVLKKHFTPAPKPPERNILEHWIYGCCLEDTRYDDADKAFQVMTGAAFDWNEIRVTTVSELAEQLSAVTNPREAAGRVKRTLQSIFESRYSFDLESLKKQNLGKTIKDMLRLHGTTSFSVSYVVQHALGGHSIPLDNGLLDAMYIIGAIDEKEREKSTVPGLERAVSKKNGVSDGSLLHQLGAELAKSPFSPHVRDLLLAINPEASPRLPKRQRKKKPEPAPEPTPEPVPEKTEIKKKKADKKPDAKKSDSKDSAATEKPAAKKKSKATAKKDAPPAKEVTKKKTIKKQSAPVNKKKTKSGKKSATKRLAKRKPR